MSAFLQDLRYSIRMLLKSPGFSGIAVITLALGIGANSAIFSVVNSALLRPLPFRAPDHLVQLWETEASPGSYPLTGPDYLDWQSQNRSFDAMSLYSWGDRVNTSGVGEAETAVRISTEANFFSVLDVQPSAGRTFAAGEDAAGKNHVVVLSYAFWQRHFGGRPDILGQTLALDNESYTIAGIMPSKFNFPAATDLWTPMDMTPKALGERGSHSYRVIGRLKEGVSVGQARADLATIAKRLEKQFPNSNGQVSAVVVPLKEQLTRNSSAQLWILLGAVALVLLIACANVANLLLARATARHREMAVRAALGASRGRLMRQLLTESVLLSLVGAGLGLVGAIWLVGYARASDSIPIPRLNPIEVDVTVLLFTIGVSLLVGILFGLAPALQTSQTALNEELKFSAHAVIGPAASRGFLRDALVVTEIAVSLALLVGAGLLLRSFAHMRNADIGVRTDNVVTMGISLPETKYADGAARRAFYDQFLARLSSIPGVQNAAICSQLPLEGGTNGYVTIPGDTDPAHASQLVEWNYITPDYFRAFAIPFFEGRNFDPADFQRAAEVSSRAIEFLNSGKSPESLPPDLGFVTIINRAMAQTFWPNQNPIGKTFKNFVSMTVVGVVGDVKEWGIRARVVPQAYFPLTAGLGFGAIGRTVVIRTEVPPTTIVGPVGRELHQIDASIALAHPRTMQQVISDNMQDANAQTALLAVFAALGLVLATVGIYGVMAYLVTQRSHEIGIRMALGAQQEEILRLVLGYGTKLTLFGLTIGTAAALALSRLLGTYVPNASPEARPGLLFGVSTRDPLTFGVVAAVLAVVALSACYIPARRASRVDPLVALRYE